MDKRRTAIFSYQEYEIDIWYKMDTYTQCIYHFSSCKS